MQESVIYQDILQRGIDRGEQRGEKRESLKINMRLIKRRFSTIEPQLESQISSLSVAKLEDLSEVLLDITSLVDLQSWLDSNS
jgi:predicted transposase YdaD